MAMLSLVKYCELIGVRCPDILATDAMCNFRVDIVLFSSVSGAKRGD